MSFDEKLWRPAIGVLKVAQESGPLWAATLVLDQIAPLGALRLWRAERVQIERLSAQLVAILSAWGMRPGDVDITVKHMLYADRHGIDSHGCSMLPHYHRQHAAGRLAMEPTVKVVRQSATTALVDGGGGLGHVPADTAMKLAIEKCRDTGIGAVAVRNSGHFGAAGAYAVLAAHEQLIGVATTNTQRPAVVPTFGAESMLGTNPVSVAAPAGRDRPFLLDMATSTVPVGKLMMQWRKGRRVPAGWATNRRGKPVRSGHAAARLRRLSPLGGGWSAGGHKGYGLAVVVELLSSLLSGANRVADGTGAASRIGHFFLALDPGRFRDVSAFATDLEAMADRLRACRRADPDQAVQVAGDPEHAAAVESDRVGIRLTRAVLEDLRAVARASGAPFLLEGGGRTR